MTRRHTTTASISLTPATKRLFQQEADKKGMKLSEWMVEAGAAALPVRTRKKVTKALPAGRPKAKE